jgi:hypothetical protein
MHPRIATFIATAYFAADASGQSIARSEPTRPEQHAPILQQADGQLRQVSSLPFTLDERHLSPVTELASLEVAGRREGGAIRLTLERGAASPTKVGSVEYVRDWGRLIRIGPIRRPIGRRRCLVEQVFGQSAAFARQGQIDS